MKVAEFLKRITEASGVSGAEGEVGGIVAEAFRTLADEVRSDVMGNIIALKRGEGLPSGEHPRVMLAGHMDEIGLMVTKVEEGFLRFTTVGGFDVRTLLGQEVLVHGRRLLRGVIGCRPPHVLTPAENERVVPLQELFIDVGYEQEPLRELVRVGDFVTVRREQIELAGGRLAAKALDDRAAVAAIGFCLDLLKKRRHQWDVYGVATVQEEVGLRGAMTSAFGVAPHLGIAIDVTFGNQFGVPEYETVEMGGGPPIGLGPNFHPKVHERLVETAKALEIPHQIDPIPGRSGTDAWAIQVTREGIPTALLSIPLRYMHTPVETVDVRDVERTGHLMAEFICGLDESFASELGVQVRRLNGQGGPTCC
ncbi:MAG: M42 family metallopeptidase [Anaerolineae bacterium]|nr:M42 family metallopeptidase [Anaerolineae bacterium]